jgi:2-oxoglutarate ferredoxin oxidoreductase subunit alpha
VQEIYDETIRAFNLAEEFRTPVVVLYDEVIAHLLESVILPQPDTVPTLTRKWASGKETTFLPYGVTEDGVPVMARPGDGHRVHVTGLTHTPDGFPTQRPDLASKATQRLLDKIELNRDRIERNETFDIEDADGVIVAIGIVARAARRAVQALRGAGLRVGLFRPVTLWPFPEDALREAAANARFVLVPEMNAGQLALEVERIVGPGKVARLNRIDGEPIAPDDIVRRVREIAA